MPPPALRVLLFLLLALAGGRAHAQLVQLSIVDRDTGQWLPTYPHRGQDWVEGTPGHRYGVRVANLTGQRVLVVLSVDGINAVSGQRADPAQAGYVLGPWESAQIDGWRKSLREVAQFVFSDPGHSYAARTGRPANVGVVGVAVFRQVPPVLPATAPPPPWAPLVEGTAAEADAPAMAAGKTANAQAMRAPARGQSLGTAHGQRQDAPVEETDFVRATPVPEQLSQVRYEDHASLVALGVLPPWRPAAPGQPQAFPGGFVPDPPQG